MKSFTIKKLYQLHSWVGLITGILLFIIAFSGAVAVFTLPELKIWANDEIRAPIQSNSQGLEQLIDDYSNRVGPEYLEEIHIRLPSSRISHASRVIFEGHFENEKGKEEHKGIVYEFHPETLEELTKTDMGTFFEQDKLDMSSFLAHFHADLHLGSPLGLILTGLLGLTLMVSIVTGLFIHRKILPQLFTFRIRKTFSLMLTDGHKVMSVWAVLFHSTIAFTGAFLGLATVILVPAAAYVSFNGDQEKLLDTFTVVKPAIISHVEQPTQLSNILEHVEENRPDLTFRDVTIMGYGDQNALVYVYGTGGEQMGGEFLSYKGATGEYIKSQARFGRLEGFTGKILDAMFPLHYGNFGGVLVKIIWCILGMITALLPISGLMLWIERGLNSQQPNHSRRTYQNFNKLLIGSCGGIVLATAALFPTQLILNRVMHDLDHTSVIFNVFFCVWLIALIIPFVVDYKKAIKLIFLLIAGLLTIVMPMDAILTSSHIFNVLETQHFVSVSVDWVLFFLGLLMLFCYKKLFSLSSEHSDSKDSEQDETLTEEKA
jgi:uncharacterized iron-regulated membrane protein